MSTLSTVGTSLPYIGLSLEGKTPDVEEKSNLSNMWRKGGGNQELVTGMRTALPQGTVDELVGALQKTFADNASMNQVMSDILPVVESQLRESVNEGRLLTGYDVLLLIMQISLQDAERQRDKREQLLPMICDISISILALATQAIKESYISNILQSMQSIMSGGVDIMAHNTSREGGGRMSTVLEQSAMAQNIIGNLLNAIAETAKGYTEQTSQGIETSLQQGEVDKRKITQEMQRIVENGNRLAQMIMDAILPVLTHK